MGIRVVLAGATGWAGSELARAIAGTGDIVLVGAVSRKNAGKSLGEVLSDQRLALGIKGSAEEALAAGCDVFFDYTRAEAAKANALAALEAGAHVVIGTSGLGQGDYAEIDAAARERGRGVLAVGNFAITVVLLQKFAEIAARYIPNVELIDYAHHDKSDAPSGTARELAFRLGRILKPGAAPLADQSRIEPGALGARLDGVQVHSLRLPGYVIGLEAIFGLPDQRLQLRHESGSSSRPYVDGALLAIRKVGSLVGLHRGLDQVMDW
jgi:4-hydroxy-tetrahydrodipicolinate reductase